jgi:uncharacterized protein (UPF0332 family)
MDPLRLNRRDVTPRKAIVAPDFGNRTVLTNTPWTFVSLWLKRNKKSEAQFYWDQAQQFYKASVGLPLQSAPLLLYYSYMNAAKALLSAKGISFSPYHGVKVHNVRGPNSKISLSNEGLRINTNGIVPSLTTYFGETETTRDYTMKELLFNSVFVHRTYCLTFRSQQEMFVPLRACKYMFDSTHGVVYLSGQFAPDIVRNITPTSLPPIFAWIDRKQRTFKSVDEITWTKNGRGRQTEMAALKSLHAKLRFDIHYINGIQPLWYLKLLTKGPKRVARRGPTITLCAMHRLSELCRYRPNELSSYLDGQQNWLLSEFISMSPEQYLDEMACEITDQQFLAPNVRAPT